MRYVIFLVVGTIALAALWWLRDSTIRDPQLIDWLIEDATWYLPKVDRPQIRRLHAWQMPRPKPCEYLYLELTRPKDFDRFVQDVTSNLSVAETKWPNRGAPEWSWKLQRDVQLNGSSFDNHAPRWWFASRSADVMLVVRGSTVLVAPADSDGIFIRHFVPD